MFNAILIAIRFTILVFNGQKQVALENAALRQQLAVFKREVKRPNSLAETDCFGSGSPTRGETGAAPWWSSSPTPWFAGIANDSVAGGPPLTAETGTPSRPDGDPPARRADGRSESALGRTADPRRTA